MTLEQKNIQNLPQEELLNVLLGTIIEWSDQNNGTTLRKIIKPEIKPQIEQPAQSAWSAWFKLSDPNERLREDSVIGNRIIRKDRFQSMSDLDDYLGIERTPPPTEIPPSFAHLNQTNSFQFDHDDSRLFVENEWIYNNDDNFRKNFEQDLPTASLTSTWGNDIPFSQMLDENEKLPGAVIEGESSPELNYATPEVSYMTVDLDSLPDLVDGLGFVETLPTLKSSIHDSIHMGMDGSIWRNNFLVDCEPSHKKSARLLSPCGVEYGRPPPKRRKIESTQNDFSVFKF